MAPQQTFQPQPLMPVQPHGAPQAPAGEAQPARDPLPSNLSQDPVIAGMQIGNFIAAAVYGARGERR